MLARLTNTVFAFITLILLSADVYAKQDDFSSWNSYFVNVNNELSSVFLNLSLHGNAPQKKYPRLAWYWIDMKAPMENGLSSQSEYDSLIEHEDALLASLVDSPLVYAGRITTQGRREFYFYTADGFDFEKFIGGSFGENAAYRYQAGQKRDQQWGHYLNLLYPGENGLKQMEKRQ
jgi:hypothetical protein